MMKFSWLNKVVGEVRSLWDESALRRAGELPRLHRCAHFCLMVGRSFSRNRCPVRAASLAYGSLLALVPMLAVIVSVTSTFLKKQGEEQIDHFIEKIVASMTAETADASQDLTTNAAPPYTNASTSFATSETSSNAPASSADEATRTKKRIVHRIHEFIQNTRSGALGLTGTAVWILAAIGMLSRIEDTFNDIWGVSRGRHWLTRLFVYWGVITLVPLFLAVALALATGPHLESTKKVLEVMPLGGLVVFQVLPVVLLCLTFTLFYVLMPNTKVQFWPALWGGLAGGSLFHLNNVLSVLYVSRIASNSKIYGSLGLVPVLMIGMYFWWLILLFGSQVAYAFQNRASYLEEKQIEQIDQRGREFIALRLLTRIGQRFAGAEPPLGVTELCGQLGVPTRLAQQLLQTLAAAGLVIEASGEETAYVPARPLERITCHDVLLALRANKGQELETSEGIAREEVYGEFKRIEEAERQAASSVTLLALVNRVQVKQLEA